MVKNKRPIFLTILNAKRRLSITVFPKMHPEVTVLLFRM